MSDEEQNPVVEKVEVEEAVEEASVEEASAEMCANMGAYLQSVLTTNCADYELLAAMNRAATEKYAHMYGVTQSLASHMGQLQTQYADLQPYLDQIDAIANTVQALEAAVGQLDDYTKRLASKFGEREARLRKLSKQMQ